MAQQHGNVPTAVWALCVAFTIYVFAKNIFRSIRALARR